MYGGNFLSNTKLKNRTLSKLLEVQNFPNEDLTSSDHLVRALQLKMLRIQQGIWQTKSRAIIIFEGFDAAGKGGSIRRLTETLDPRSLRVHSIGPPTEVEQGKHYLYRFWSKLPKPGTIAVFDRSWYGRVLIERVEGLTTKSRLKDAYSEINQFEKTLTTDGIDLVKIFLAIHPEEQLKRFKIRLNDPYKQWKLTDEDLEAHRKWDKYVRAGDDLLHLTDTQSAPWNLIPADSKDYARNQVLSIVTKTLAPHGNKLENLVQKNKYKNLHKSLKDLEREEQKWKKR